jgi:hypothetical protein
MSKDTDKNTYILLTEKYRLLVNTDDYALQQWLEAREGRNPHTGETVVKEAGWQSLSKYFPTVSQAVAHLLGWALSQEEQKVYTLQHYMEAKRALWEEIKSFSEVPEGIAPLVVKPRPKKEANSE